MPVAVDPGRPDGRALLDPEGRVVARFVRRDREGRRMAHLLEREPGVPLEPVLAAVTADLAERVLTTLSVVVPG